MSIDVKPSDAFPVIVYGTLRHGFGNDRLWAGLGVHQPAILPGFRIYAVRHGEFPVVERTHDDHDEVLVDVVFWHSTAHAMKGIENMDWLEGHPTLYLRQKATAYLESGDPVTGWLYVPADDHLLRGAMPIPSGNWADHARSSV